MLEAEILNLSRQAQSGGLSPWFARHLAVQIEDELFLPPSKLRQVQEKLVRQLTAYRQQAGVTTAVLGMSGGVDSAVTAALFKAAGWRVIGLTLPIHQNPDETERGIDACRALDLEHLHHDLSVEYDAMVAGLGRLDPAITTGEEEALRTRRGNLRARLRMMTLYDQAHRHGGIVASTDNFSEFGAGFWTLHGDVGDLAPVQGLLKSWEIPWLARNIGVPEHTWRAKPTDGLGIGAGDEAQIGASYLEWDIAIFALDKIRQEHPGVSTPELDGLLQTEGDDHARTVLQTVLRRLGGTWYKRINPINLDHPLSDRLALMDKLDERLFRPDTLRQRTVKLDVPVDLHAAATELCKRLSDRNMHLVTAESCTGGLLAASISEVGGSSSALEGSFVTYSPALKIAALGVSTHLIEERTVYDPQVAVQMAQGALEVAGDAGLALAVTGVGGPDDDQGKPAGYVCIAACLRGGEPVVKEFNFPAQPQAVLAAATSAALEMGLSMLAEDDGAGG